MAWGNAYSLCKQNGVVTFVTRRVWHTVCCIPILGHYSPFVVWFHFWITHLMNKSHLVLNKKLLHVTFFCCGHHFCSKWYILWFDIFLHEIGSERAKDCWVDWAVAWVHTFLSIIPRHPWFKNYLKQKWQLLSKTWVLPKVIATVEKLYFERKKSFTAVLKCILQEHCNVILWLTLLFCWQLLFSVAVFRNCKYQCVMYSDLHGNRAADKPTAPPLPRLSLPSELWLGFAVVQS